MTNVPDKITDFISENDILTLSTSCQNLPYCATVFYVFFPEKNRLVFMSDKTTKHIQHALSNNHVAGTILAKNVSLTKIRGLQFSGRFFEINEDFKKCKTEYLKKFPVAALHDSLFWGIEFSFLKLTDNRLGFGKKILWDAKNETV